MNIELNILRIFFENIIVMKPLDNKVSESKVIRDTKNQLKVALRNSTERCTCAKRSYGGPCEVCQASGDSEIVILRNFFRVIRNAKKHDMTAADIQEFIENTKSRIKPVERK